MGGDVNTMRIYNETIKLIDKANNLEKDQKTQAKGILEHVKTNAPQFLPLIVEAVKKALGL